MGLYLPYVVISNLINPIPKLKSLSIIELVAKKKATPMVQPFDFVGMGRLTFTLCYLMVISIVIKNCTENCTAKLLTEIKVENYFFNWISSITHNPVILAITSLSKILLPKCINGLIIIVNPSIEKNKAMQMSWKKSAWPFIPY